MTTLVPQPAALSDVGRSRPGNEDSFGVPAQQEIAPPVLAKHGYLYVVCDGMGGHASGEYASALAVKTICSAYYGEQRRNPVRNMMAAVAAANTRIMDEAAKDPSMGGMGTTLVAALVSGDTVHVFNAGDSRAYLVHERGLRRITRDHSWVGEQVRAGTLSEEQAKQHQFRSVITRSLGTQKDVKPDVFTLRPAEGDILLLCSDGLWDVVADEDIRKVLLSYRADPRAAAAELVRLANEAGGPDNITVVVIPLRAAPARRGLAVVLFLLVAAALAAAVWLAGPSDAQQQMRDALGALATKLSSLWQSLAKR